MVLGVYRVRRENDVSGQTTILKQLASQTFETVVSIIPGRNQNPDDGFEKMMALTVVLPSTKLQIPDGSSEANLSTLHDST
jgi:hypothetical protein